MEVKRRASDVLQEKLVEERTLREEEGIRLKGEMAAARDAADSAARLLKDETQAEIARALDAKASSDAGEERLVSRTWRGRDLVPWQAVAEATRVLRPSTNASLASTRCFFHRYIDVTAPDARSAWR